MGRGRALRILRLIERREHRRDGRADVVAEQHRNRAGKADDGMHAVRSRLLRDVLEHRDRGRRALRNQRHRAADQQTENRNVRHTLNHRRKHRALRKRLHDRPHRLNAEKQQPKAENRPADRLDLPGFPGKIHQKSGGNDDPDIVAQLKRNELRSHGRSNVGTENHGNCLRQRHQTCAHEADRHDRGRRRALQHRGHQGARQHAHHRVDRQHAEDLLHLLPRRTLQVVAHHRHAVQKNRQAAQQPEQNLNRFTHTVSLPPVNLRILDGPFTCRLTLFVHCLFSGRFLSRTIRGM